MKQQNKVWLKQRAQAIRQKFPQATPAEIDTYEDHRMATAGAVLGLAVPGVQVQDVATTAKTIPDFPGRWAALLAGTDYAA